MGSAAGTLAIARVNRLGYGYPVFFPHIQKPNNQPLQLLISTETHLVDSDMTWCGDDCIGVVRVRIGVVQIGKLEKSGAFAVVTVTANRR